MSPVFGEIDEAACADKKISYVTTTNVISGIFLTCFFPSHILKQKWVLLTPCEQFMLFCDTSTTSTVRLHEITEEPLVCIAVIQAVFEHTYPEERQVRAVSDHDVHRD